MNKFNHMYCLRLHSAVLQHSEKLKHSESNANTIIFHMVSTNNLALFCVSSAALYLYSINQPPQLISY